MKYFYLIILLSLIFSGKLLHAQNLRNEGQINVAGGYLVISGNYQNETQGSIILNGSITVSGNWTNNGSSKIIDNPDTNGEVIFNGTGTQTIGGTANIFNFEKLQVNSGSITQVAAGKGVSAYGACTFINPLVLKASTSINAFHPQIATFINYSSVSGNITMELPYTSIGSSAAGAGRGMYFSSPISNATAAIFNVAAGANLLWYQNEVLRQYVKVIKNTDPLTVSKGYILRSATSNTFSFTGQPNTASSYSNNNIQRVATGHFYLFGNPYPSAIDWDAVAKTNIYSTIWYQTCSGTGSMIVDTWNSDSKVGTNNNGISQVSGKIAPMQSFWIQCSEVGKTGTITLSNNNRIHNQGSTTILKSAQIDNKNIVRINLYTGEMKDETIIVESSLADDNFDNGDSRKMFQKDGKRAEIYTLSNDINNKNLVIQSIKPVASDKSIRLGVYTGVSGDYRLKVNISDSTSTEKIFLEDTRQDSIQDLFLNPEYAFSSDASEDTSRFILHFYKMPVVKVKSSLAVCSPNLADLTSTFVTEGSDTGLTYTYWTNNTATIPYTAPSSAVAGTYYIKGSANNGMSSIVGPVQVITNPVPTIVVNNPPAISSTATIDITVPEITSGSSEGLKYSYWLDQKATIPFSIPQFAVPGQYYIKGTFETTGCYNISSPVQVTVTSKTTGNGTKVGETTVIYAHDNLIYLKKCELKSVVYIYDLLGRIVFSKVVSDEQEIIDPGLKTGNYLLKVVSHNTVFAKKLFIGHGRY